MARARAAGCGAAPAASAFGFMLVLICARCSAFLVASSCSGRMVLGRTRSVQHTHNLCAPQQQRGALAMANDFQENALGISIGDRVRVKQMEQRFYHIQAFKDEGLDATGFEGEVKDIKLVSKKTGKEITANRPVMVAFTAPHKFMAHFEFDELDRA
eukprot:TRINITY_DN735_c0_g1_i1.p1 TRINITY_DN735_c0_g1~~TRINITY_DN735_c0_g1_i1.p1  ORF type:complete len:174 (-),score=53.48 TRINITY_DN735_c0_g1_i1:480-950(-)